jgi:hypothetical protein
MVGPVKPTRILSSTEAMSDLNSLSIVTLVLVLIFLSSILVTQPLPFHVRIIGWPRITIDSMTAPVVLAIILCAAQSISTSQVCDGILGAFAEVLVACLINFRTSRRYRQPFYLSNVHGHYSRRGKQCPKAISILLLSPCRRHHTSSSRHTFTI